MGSVEQEKIRRKHYEEAIRYMDNAKETLKKAGKVDRFYIDKKLLNYVNEAYNSLHLFGYYDGSKDSRIILEGFDLAYVIIERLKPAA